MKEFMFYVYNTGDPKASWSAEKHLSFVKQCEAYIGKLQSQQQLIAAQPVGRAGFVLTRNENGWSKTATDLSKDVHVGYYHILAHDIDEAVEIAKANPEFDHVASARIEVLPLKVTEEKTEFNYPR